MILLLRCNEEASHYDNFNAFASDGVSHADALLGVVSDPEREIRALYNATLQRLAETPQPEEDEEEGIALADDDVEEREPLEDGDDADVLAEDEADAALVPAGVLFCSLCLLKLPTSLHQL